MDDREAIRRMKNGEIGGLEILVNRYQVKAVRAAFLVVYDKALAEDIVQETFIRLYQRIHHFDDPTRRTLPDAQRGQRRPEHHPPDGKSISLDADPALLESLLEGAVSVETTGGVCPTVP